MKTAFDAGRLRASILTLTCVKCRRAQTFGVSDVPQGRIDVAKAGWIQREGVTVCPKCPRTSQEKEQARQAANG